MPISRVAVDARFDVLGLTGNSLLLRRSIAASGLGDIPVKAKYTFVRRETGGVAAGAELRLPTGDQENVLGTGRTQLKLLGIASAEVGRFAPHVNIGFAIDPVESPGGNQGRASERSQHEFSYTGGAKIIAHRSVTMVADVVGRFLHDIDRFRTNSSGVIGYSDATTLNLILGSAGVKVNVDGALLGRRVA